MIVRNRTLVIELTISIDVSIDAGGFGSYMLAMDQKTYELIGTDYPGNRAVDVKNPSLSWMIGFMFLVSFIGIFSLVALRKVITLLTRCLRLSHLHFCFEPSAGSWTTLCVIQIWQTKLSFGVC